MDDFRGDEIQPGINIDSDAEIDQWVKENVESAYHPAGTCKMGLIEDETSVVDKECRVHGLVNLRVVDASIFPTLPNGNINAPVIMIAEKAADLILGKRTLDPANIKIAPPKHWETDQREGYPQRNN
jgi:choline dehydrogenase